MSKNRPFVVNCRATSDSPNEYDLEIVGIFESENTKREGSQLEIPENLIISDINTLKTLYGYSDGQIQYTSAVYNTSKNVDDVISSLNKISEDWSLYTILKSEDTFLALSKSFDAMEKIRSMRIVLHTPNEQKSSKSKVIRYSGEEVKCKF